MAVFQMYADRQRAASQMGDVPPLEETIPQDVQGWSFETLPLAMSQEQLSAIEGILNYDDVFYGRYSKGDVDVSLYVSFWKPGSMAYDLAGFHTPDVCWVETGWTRNAREYAVERTIEGQPLKPYEYGIFEKDGYVMHVVFWHLIHGEPQSYRQFGYDKSLKARLERLKNKFMDSVRYGFKEHPQFFIRISTTEPMDKLWQDSDFVHLMKALSTIGFAKDL